MNLSMSSLLVFLPTLILRAFRAMSSGTPEHNRVSEGLYKCQHIHVCMSMVISGVYTVRLKNFVDFLTNKHMKYFSTVGEFITNNSVPKRLIIHEANAFDS